VSIEASNQRQACVDLAIAEKAETIVEIGVYGGRLSRMLLKVPTLKELFLVDSWKGSSPNRQPPHFLVWTDAEMAVVARKVKAWASQNKKVKVLHMSSVRAAAKFGNESLDFVYIDGDHTFQGVTADIESWLPKLRMGGVLSGDDYYMPSVHAAIEGRLQTWGVADNGRLWWYRKKD
jgi:Methyltransferase domain